MNLEKRRHNLGEYQHRSESKIMIFLRNAAKIKEVLNLGVFDFEVNNKLKLQFRKLVPWDYYTPDMDEYMAESDDESVPDSLELEDSQTDGISNTVNGTHTGTGPSQKSQIIEERFQRPNRSQTRNTGRKTTSNTDENVQPISEGDTGYSFDSLSHTEDSIDIYDESKDKLQSTGNGLNLEVMNNPVRYPFIIVFL